MALYTILFGLSIFMIALVMAIIKKMFFHWQEEHNNQRVIRTTVDRPAVSVMIYSDKCVVKKRRYTGGIDIYDVMSKSEISLPKNDEDPSNVP